MRNHKGFVYVKATVIVMALLIGLAITIAVGAEYEGTWQPDTTSEPEPAVTCPSGSVCAEWDVGGASYGSCCISPESLGSGDLEACEGSLVQSCEGTY